MSIPEISVATYEANESTYNAEPFDILDTAANITAALGTLNGVSTLQEIFVSDNASLSISASQVTNDATALGKLMNNNGTSATLTVTDTNTAISSNFNAIAANGNITSIVVSNNSPVLVSVTQLINNASTLSVITNANSTAATFTATGSAAQIGLQFAAIGANSAVTTININNNSTVTISAVQAADNNTAVQELVNANSTAVNVTVKDTAANISANLNGILSAGGNITNILVSNSVPLSLTAAQVAADSSLFSIIHNNNGGAVTFNISDTSTDFSNHLSSVEAINSQVGHVSFTDTSPALTVSQTVFTSDSSLISKINSNFALTITGVTVANVGSVTSTANGLSNHSDITLSIQILDTGANISGAFDTLNGNSAITKIVITSGSVTIDAASAVNDTAALGELYQSNGTTPAQVAVSDTANAVASGLNGLETNVSHISTITLTDGSTPTITLNYVSFSPDTAVLAKISTAFDLGVNGASIAQAASISGTLTSDSINATLTSLGITDTAANVSTDLGLGGSSNLESFYTGGLLSSGSIILSDVPTPTVTVSYGNFSSNAQHVLNDISSTYDLAVTGVSVANLSNVLPNPTNAAAISVTVTDTAANIEGGLSTLLSDNSSITSITASPAAVPAFTLSESAYSSDGTLLAKITNGFTVALTGVAAADAGTLSADTHVTSITVSDTPADIVTNWSSLETAFAAGKLTEVSFSGTITIPASDIFSGSTSTFSTAGQGVFNALNVTNFTVDFTGLTVAQTGALSTLLSGNSHATLGTITVSDSSANVQNDLALGGSSVLESYISNLSTGAITLTDGVGTAAITVTYAHFTANAQTVLNDIGTDFDLTVTGVAVSNVESVLDTLITNSSVRITVSDTGANISSGLSTLENNVSGIISISASSGSITFALTDTGGGTPYSTYTNVLSLVQSPFTVDVTGVLAADAATVNSAIEGLTNHSSITLSIAVADNAANVVANASALTSANHVTAVLVTDTGTNVGTNLDALDSVANLAVHISSGTLLVSESAFVGGLTTLGAINNGSWTVGVQNVTVAQRGTVESDFSGLGNHAAGTLNIQISDTASKVAAAVSTLNGDTHVTMVIATDTAAHIASYLDNLNGITAPMQIYFSGPTVLTLSYAQLNNGLSALADVQNAFTLDVNATAANVSTVASDVSGLSNHGNITLHTAVSDTAQHVVANLSAINNASDHVSSVTVTDTAANIATYLNSLNSVTPTLAIDISPAGTLTVTYAQLSDTVALDAISDAGNLVVTTVSAANASGLQSALSSEYPHFTLTGIDVTDTATNIESNLDALGGNSLVKQIVISDNNPIDLTLSELYTSPSAPIAAAQTAIGLLINANSTAAVVNVSDTAADLPAYMDDLNSLSGITKIIISDNNPLTLTAEEAGSDLTAVGKLENANSSGVVINVVDTGANISAHLSGLQNDTDVATITDSDNSAITVTVATLDADQVVLSEIQNANSSQVQLTVSDTAANIVTNLAQISEDISSSSPQVTHVVISDNNPLMLTVHQVVTYSNVLTSSVLSDQSGSPYVIDVSDNSGNISSHFATLATTSNIGTITITNDGSITLTCAELTGDASTLAKLANQNGSTVTYTIDDTAADISTNFAAIGANSHVTSVVISDNGALTLTATEVGTYASLLPELSNQNSGQVVIDVTDTAANIEANFDALNSSLVASIVNTSNGNLVLSVEQAHYDTHALSVLTNQNSSSFTVSVSDTASHIANNFAWLNSDAGNLTGIVISNNAALALTVAELSDTAALNITTNQNASPIAINITDTAADISNGLDMIEANNDVDAETISDNGIVMVSSIAQLNADASVIADLANANGQTVNVTVTDTGANIQTNLAELNQNMKITSIVISDNSALSVNMATVVNDTRALEELHNQNSSAVNLTVSDTAANIQGEFDDLQQIIAALTSVIDTNNAALAISAEPVINDLPALEKVTDKSGATAIFNVSDTAANITSALTNLETLSGQSHLGTVTVTGGGTLDITYSTYSADQAVVTGLKGAHVLEVTSITGSQMINGNTYQSFSATFDSNNHITNETYYSGTNLDGTVETDLNITYNQSVYGLTGAQVDKYTQVPGQNYVERDVVFSAGSEALRVTETTNGTLTYGPAINGLTLPGTASTASVFNVTGHTETFDFGGSFGTDTITGYASPDTINFGGNFGSVSAVEAAETQVGNNVVITLDAHDTITIASTTESAFNATHADWLFT